MRSVPWINTDKKISFQTGGVAIIGAGVVFLAGGSTKLLLSRAASDTQGEMFLLLGLGMIAGGIAKLPRVTSVWLRWVCGVTAVALVAVALFLALRTIYSGG
jgi:hypothetical protein